MRCEKRVQRVVPLSAIIASKRKNKYGSIQGLPDDELADPEELERQVHIQEFGPVLALPVRGRRWQIQPAIDESGGVGWGAFGTVDFERLTGGIDRSLNKMDELWERYRDTLIMLGIVRQRLPKMATRLVLKHLRMGVIEVGHVADFWMYQAAELDSRARRIRREIVQLEEGQRERERRSVEVMLARW